MKKTIFSKAIAILGAIAMLAGVAACGQSNNAGESGNGLNKVMFMLSWAPDTNHIGVYVAKNKGYFKQAGLDVDIVAVAQAGAEQAVNNGVADFALSNLTNVGMYTHEGCKNQAGHAGTAEAERHLVFTRIEQGYQITEGFRRQNLRHVRLQRIRRSDPPHDPDRRR